MERKERLTLNIHKNQTKSTATTIKLRALVYTKQQQLCNFYGRPAQQMRTLYFAVFFFFLYFPRLISAVADWISAILAHMVWP